MLEPNELFGLCVLLLGIMVVPGMDMALVAGTALRKGTTAAWSALAGIVTGGAILAVWTAAITVFLLFRASLLLACVLAFGAIYLGWLALIFLHESVRAAPLATAMEMAAGGRTGSVVKPYAVGIATCVVNPKAHIFLLSVLPPLFSRHPASVPLVVVEYSVLAAIFQVGVYGLVIAGVDGSASKLIGLPNIRRWVSAGLGVVLLAAAVVGAHQAILAFQGDLIR
jgi:threonine/homoserine/homoserine lactone efflux protein